MDEANIVQMAARLKQWGTKLDDLIAKVAASGADAGIDSRRGIDDLKTKYQVARARFDELKTAGSAQWRIFEPGIERAGNDFETAFEKLQNAASVAALMLTTEVLIAERTKGDKDASAAGANDDMGGMGM
jgi:hypothetical protein